MTIAIDLATFQKRLKKVLPQIKVLVFNGIKQVGTFYCKVHKVIFDRLGESLLTSKGCPVCAVESSKEKHSETWLKTHFLNIQYRNKQDLNKVTLEFIGPYKGYKIETEYCCSKHGRFLAVPFIADGYKHACPKCYNESLKGPRISTIDRAKEEIRKAHPSLRVAYKDYITQKTPVRWKCIEHGTHGKAMLDSIRKRKACCSVSRTKVKSESQIKSTNQFVQELSITQPSLKVVKYTGSQKKCKVRCKACGHKWSALGTSLSSGHGCPKCSKSSRISRAEDDIFHLISKKFPDARQSDRTIIKPKELDIVIPSKKLAIEYNGSYFHAEHRIGRYAHMEKTKMCEKVGWRLIHIHEVDWIHKRRIVLKTLAHALGINKKKFQARKLQLKSVSGLSARKFFERNHIQGLSYSPMVTFGLFLNDVPIAMMAFDRPRRGAFTNGEYELARFTSIGSVAGGASRLLSNFIKEYKPSKIVSFSANDWFSGQMYQTLGFTLEKELPPDYFVLLEGYKRNKQAVTREKLRKLLEKEFDENRSERENCENARIWRVFDSGKRKWVLDLNKNRAII